MVGPLFRAVARLRSSRAVHPEGAVREATLTAVAGGPLPPGEHPALVRLSRGIGLPDAMPEIVGLALRAVDLDQDLLLAGLGRDPRTNPSSSLLPFEAGGRRFRYHATPEDGGFALLAGGERFATLRLGALSDEEPRFDVFLHTGGGIRPAGVINRLRRPAYAGSREGWSTPSR